MRKISINRLLANKVAGSFAAATICGFAGYAIFLYFRPINAIGPFSEEKTAFIRSEDGNITIANVHIKDGSFIESIGGVEKVQGRLAKGKDGSFSINNDGTVSYNCLSSDESKAVCGSVRFQKSLGKFQFDRKIPFQMEETIYHPRGIGANAKQNATIMFKSEDQSFWVKSEKVGTYNFLTPTSFEITWKTPAILWNGAGYSDEYIIRTANCTFHAEPIQSVICEGTSKIDIASYTAIWTLIDSDDVPSMKSDETLD